MITYQLTFTTDEDTIPLLNSLKRERDDNVSGYYNLPYNSNIILDSLNLIREKEPFISAKRVVVLGIGGSSLGTKALYRLLKKSDKEILFLENPDPLEVYEKLSDIDKNSTIFTIISKSGNTIETLSIFKVLISSLNIDLLEESDRFIVISDENSPLDKFAKEYQILTFHIPKSVGGRFSVLSAVGLVPLGITGFDIKRVVNGARDFLDRFWQNREAHLLKKAIFIAKNAKEFDQSVLFAYSSYLDEFSKWYVQLWGESLGKIDKSGLRVGLTPIANIGSIDQHSFLQLIMEGPKNKALTFIKISKFDKDIKIPEISLKHLEKSNFVNGYSLGELLNSECDATFESVLKLGIPVDMITLDKISEENIGELVIYYELLTSAVGILLGINTYNQEGVEIGKRILRDKFQNS